MRSTCTLGPRLVRGATRSPTDLGVTDFERCRGAMVAAGKGLPYAQGRRVRVLHHDRRAGFRGADLMRALEVEGGEHLQMLAAPRRRTGR